MKHKDNKPHDNKTHKQAEPCNSCGGTGFCPNCGGTPGGCSACDYDSQGRCTTCHGTGDAPKKGR